ncbi:hypothetical protein RSOLAG1IB_08621 [Rhizoctonia solani AG-1 IB]|uniref:Uncharacterized protein n=1 Tax=Thanatephorus cucumeris (strain AG1-IB / isolate 7/3/14) TaxID=1108050 RepID=A0A0B7FNN6_THACB|nr:hypothetical protein RSOLAG1IB_08621 [Rhizoctonia solani AG-1 IB]
MENWQFLAFSETVGCLSACVPAVRVCTGARGGARAGTWAQGGGERSRTRSRDQLSFTTDHTHVVRSVYRLVFLSHPPSLYCEQ